MPRKPRFFLPEMPVHIVQRGHSREPVFFEDDDYLTYLRWLKEGAARYKVDIHAYALMTNHIHILASAHDNDGITRMMPRLKGSEPFNSFTPCDIFFASQLAV